MKTNLVGDSEAEKPTAKVLPSPPGVPNRTDESYSSLLESAPNENRLFGIQSIEHDDQQGTNDDVQAKANASLTHHSVASLPVSNISFAAM